MSLRNKISFIVFAALAQMVFSQTFDSLQINYNYINSTPQNADVFVGDELIGQTPLFFMWKDTVFPKLVTVKFRGFIDYTESIKDASKLSRSYVLVPLSGKGKIDLVKEDRGTYFSKPRKVVPIILSALVAAGAGSAAYYFKSLAIENRDHYNTYGDQESLDRKKKYNLLSGISIFVFQAGLGALIYFLLIE